MNLAHGTLTRPEMFENWKFYGDPRGSMTITALNLAKPNWIFEEEFRPMVITWAFIAGVAILLAIANMTGGDKNKTASGIEKDSKVSMKEFIEAILVDNPASERQIGFSDDDIIEVYQQSAEMIALEESLQGKGSVSDVFKFCIKRAREM